MTARGRQMRGARAVVVPAYAALVWSGVARPANACSLSAEARTELPRKDVPRLAGVVTGHVQAPASLGPFKGASALMIRVDDVVSGPLSKGETLVVPLPFGPSCQTVPYQPKDIERFYPVGTPVVVLGDLRKAPETRAGVAVVAEMNRGGYVEAVPANVPRTSNGDLDFGRYDANLRWLFREFEFDRVVLTLNGAPVATRAERLRNLARYAGFADMPSSRQTYGKLVLGSGVSPADRDRLLHEFDGILRSRR